MVRLSSIKVVFVVMLLVLAAFLFMKNNISNYYEGPMTISQNTSTRAEKFDVEEFPQ